MNKITLLGGMVLCILTLGCAPNYSLMDSDGHSTKKISPRERAQLSCLKEESTGKCMRFKGYYSLKDQTPSGVKVDEWGCPLDSDGDGVPDHLDKCPGTPQGALVDEDGCWTIGDTLFDFDKDNIKAEYDSVLNQVVTVFERNPSLKAEIQGHTDNFGTRAYNQKLSNRRAQTVVNYLVRGGVGRERLYPVGYDFSRPRASNETEDGRALNRRVEILPVP